MVRHVPHYWTELDAILRALADPTRRAVVERLSESPAMVSELAAPFAMALPSVDEQERFAIELARALMERDDGSGVDGERRDAREAGEPGRVFRGGHAPPVRSCRSIRLSWL